MIEISYLGLCYVCALAFAAGVCVGIFTLALVAKHICDYCEHCDDEEA